MDAALEAGLEEFFQRAVIDYQTNEAAFKLCLEGMLFHGGKLWHSMGKPKLPVKLLLGDLAETVLHATDDELRKA